MLNLHLYPSTLSHESRILRLTKSLADARLFSAIEVIGIAASGLPDNEKLDDVRSFVRVPANLYGNGRNVFGRLLQLVSWSIAVLVRLRGRNVDCVNAHSLSVLPLCLVISGWKKARLIYDTHELETETAGSAGVRRQVTRVIEALCIRRCSLVFVVSDSIARWYETRYRIPRPTVIRNIPSNPRAASRSTTELRQKVGIADERVLFLFLGGLTEGRSIETLLTAFERCPEHSIVFMGDGSLASRVDEYEARCMNIVRLPPVSPADVVDMARTADVGVCLTEPLCLSHEYSLPNKFFEYLVAGLPVLCSPLVELRSIVDRFDCGWLVTPSVDELIQLLKSIDRTVVLDKRKCAAGVPVEYNWENEETRLLSAYGRLASAA
jgi:glycosyltransferase involved in cell wall biosynthesis